MKKIEKISELTVSNGVRCLALRGERLLAVGLDLDVELVELGSWELVHKISGFFFQGMMTRVEDIAFCSDGSVLVASWQPKVRKFAPGPSFEHVWTYRVPSDVSGLACLDDGHVAVACSNNGAVHILAEGTGAEVAVCRTQPVVTVRAVVPLGGSMFAAGYTDGVRVWRSDGGLLRVIEGAAPVCRLAFSERGLGAAGCDDGGIRFFDPLEGAGWGLALPTVAEQSAVSGLDFAPNGRLLAACFADRNTVFLFSCVTGECVSRAPGHSDGVTSVLFSRDGAKVISGSQDKTVRVWRVFAAAERRARALVGGLEVGVEDWEIKEVCCEVVRRMMRLWEVEVVRERWDASFTSFSFPSSLAAGPRR